MSLRWPARRKSLEQFVPSLPPADLQMLYEVRDEVDTLLRSANEEIVVAGQPAGGVVWLDNSYAEGFGCMMSVAMFAKRQVFSVNGEGGSPATGEAASKPRAPTRQIWMATCATVVLDNCMTSSHPVRSRFRILPSHELPDGHTSDVMYLGSLEMEGF